MEGKPIRSVAIELFQRWIQTASDTGELGVSVHFISNMNYSVVIEQVK